MHTDDIWLITDEKFEEHIEIVNQIDEKIRTLFTVQDYFPKIPFSKEYSINQLSSLKEYFEEAQQHCPPNTKVTFMTTCNVLIRGTQGLIPTGFLCFPVYSADDIWKKVSIYTNDPEAREAKLEISGALACYNDNEFWSYTTRIPMTYMVNLIA